VETSKERLSDLVASLEDAYEIVRNDIQKNHGVKIAPAQIIVARDETGRKHGHFTTVEAWKGSQGYHEIFMSGQSLERGAVATLGTLLHEMAHAVNHAEDIADTSGDGYHNKKFQKTAQDVFGLEIKKAPRVGFSETTVPDSTVERWHEAIARIEEGLKLSALGVMGKGKAGRNKNNPVAICGCGEKIRLSLKTLEMCRPKCQECEQEFTVEN
jgi:hypothetical protein